MENQQTEHRFNQSSLTNGSSYPYAMGMFVLGEVGVGKGKEERWRKGSTSGLIRNANTVRSHPFKSTP